MKHKNTPHHLRLLAALLLSSAALLASCTRADDDDPRRPGTSAGGNASGPCVLLPPTVVAAPFGAEAPATRSITTPEDEQICSISGDLVNTLAVDINPQATDSQASTPQSGDPQTRATTETIATGVFYRLVIFSYDATNRTIIAQRLCKVGDADNYYKDNGTTTDDPISLPPNTSYKVVCYSCNSTVAADLPALTAVDGAFNFRIPNGKDFMVSALTSFYSSASATLGSFTLNHKCCRLSATISAEDFADNNILATPTLSVTGNLCKDGRNWNLIDAALADDGTLSTTEFSVPLTRTLTDASVATYTGAIYIVPTIKEKVTSPDNAQTLSVTYDFYVNGGSDGQKHSSVTNQTLKDYPAGVETDKQFYLLAGSDFSFTVKAMGVYTVSATDPTLNGMKWARTNLRNDFTFESKPWITGAWRGNNVPLTTSGSSITVNSETNHHWRWGLLDVDLLQEAMSPVPADGIWEKTKDPCRKAGRWMMPSKEAYDNLVLKIVALKWVKRDASETPKRTTKSGYLLESGYKAPGCVFADGKDNVLFLPAGGIRLKNTLYESSRAYVRYWSNTNDIINHNTGGWAYMLTSISGKIEVTSTYTSYAYPIRCVESDDPATDVTPPGGVTDGGWTDDPFDNVEIPVGD